MIDVILPVLNEVEALGWVLARMPNGYRAIVVDNGSTDGSGHRARELGAQVVHEARRGFGSACFAGLMAATEPIVCFMDCDASFDPGDLSTVSQPVESGRADLVLGARAAERGAWPWHARMANRVLAQMVNWSIASHLSDLGPMRAARRVDLVNLALTDRRSGWPLEMVLKADRAGWKIEEVSVPYRPRIGTSKVTGTARGVVQATRDMRQQLAAS
jgi:glycosyltransferase involved in cell wall biosynthesis